MISFIEDQRIVYGVDSICRVLPIVPSIVREGIVQQCHVNSLVVAMSQK